MFENANNKKALCTSWISNSILKQTQWAIAMYFDLGQLSFLTKILYFTDNVSKWIFIGELQLGSNYSSGIVINANAAQNISKNLETVTFLRWLKSAVGNLVLFIVLEEFQIFICKRRSLHDFGAGYWQFLALSVIYSSMSYNFSSLRRELGSWKETGMFQLNLPDRHVELFSSSVVKVKIFCTP